GGVHRLFSQEFGRLGIEVAFVDPLESRTWKRALKKNTRAIFVETPTNPLLRVIDLEPVAALCKAEGLALLVDSTFATPLNLRPRSPWPSGAAGSRSLRPCTTPGSRRMSITKSRSGP